MRSYLTYAIAVLIALCLDGTAWADLDLTGSSKINFPDGTSQSTAYPGVSGGGAGNTAGGTFAVVGGGSGNAAGGSLSARRLDAV